MNDNDLMTAVRESFTGVRSATEVERIVSRSRAIRARRRVSGVTAAVAAVGVAAGAAVAVSAALPAGSPAAGRTPASHPSRVPGVRLAAWTVARQADGNIKITFREASDVAGLQRTLRADGVPASVAFAGHQNPACRPYSSGTAIWPFGSVPGPFHLRGFFHDPKEAYTSRYALVIDPAAVHSGEGVQILVSGTPGATDNFALVTSLVKASPQCTGS